MGVKKRFWRDIGRSLIFHELNCVHLTQIMEILCWKTFSPHKKYYSNIEIKQVLYNFINPKGKYNCFCSYVNMLHLFEVNRDAVLLAIIVHIADIHFFLRKIMG